MEQRSDPPQATITPMASKNAELLPVHVVATQAKRSVVLTFDVIMTMLSSLHVKPTALTAKSARGDWSQPSRGKRCV